jgi:hypothetical protein
MDLLFAFFIIAFVIETMLLIGIYIQRKPDSVKKLPLISFLLRFHEFNMKSVDNGNQLKDIGLKIMYTGIIAAVIEYFYTIYYMDKSLSFIPMLNEYFINFSPSFTFLGTGFAIYAFGVTLLGLQKNKE